MIQILLIALYLVAIVAANLIVAALGPSASIYLAFFFIGFDLVARDRLHEIWHTRGLAWKMGALIATGSAISYILNAGAGQIALASLVAFALAAVADTTVFTWLRQHHWFVRSNGSNVAGAAVDSIIFPVMAFGAVLPWVMLGQFVAKVAGGFIWSVALSYTRKRLAAGREEVPTLVESEA